MFAALMTLHILAAIMLVLVVLLQTGRGAELGAAFGGMGQATSGRGQSTFITKFTTAIAVVFMTTSLTLAFIYTESPRQSILTEQSTPATTPAPAGATPGEGGQSGTESSPPASGSGAGGTADSTSPAAAGSAPANTPK